LEITHGALLLSPPTDSLMGAKMLLAKQGKSTKGDSEVKDPWKRNLHST